MAKDEAPVECKRCGCAHCPMTERTESQWKGKAWEKRVHVCRHCGHRFRVRRELRGRRSPETN